MEQDHPGVPVFGTVEDLLAAGVSAVTVCTPAATHTAVADDLLRRGVPVVCDKPFALDAGPPAGRSSWPSGPACCSAPTRTGAGTPTC